MYSVESKGRSLCFYRNRAMLGKVSRAKGVWWAHGKQQQKPFVKFREAVAYLNEKMADEYDDSTLYYRLVDSSLLEE